MYEFGIREFRSIEEFPGSKKAFGSKPMMVFLGELWQNDVVYSKMQNLFLDFFRGFKPDKICLTGIDHVISCTAYEGNIYIRCYSVHYTKVVGSSIPALSLQPMGPYLDLEVRRQQLASEDLWKVACRKPKNLTAPKVKNIEKSAKGDKIGRIHMKKQNLDELAGSTRRVPALRGKKRDRDGEEGQNSSSKFNKKQKK